MSTAAPGKPASACPLAHTQVLPAVPCEAKEAAPVGTSRGSAWQFARGSWPCGSLHLAGCWACANQRSALGVLHGPQGAPWPAPLENLNYCSGAEPASPGPLHFIGVSAWGHSDMLYPKLSQLSRKLCGGPGGSHFSKKCATPLLVSFVQDLGDSGEPRI